MPINNSIFDSFPVLSTNRLTLREIKIEDANEIFEMRSSGRVNQFIARDNMSHIDNSIQLIEKTQKAFIDKLGIGWAGVLRDNKKIIGTCGFNHIDYANHRAEIGGELDVKYWGKNIALEAVESIIKFGLDIMNLHTIEAKLSPDNKGAVFLLECIGFKKEALFKDRIFYKDHYLDMAVYTLLKGNEKFLV